MKTRVTLTESIENGKETLGKLSTWHQKQSHMKKISHDSEFAAYFFGVALETESFTWRMDGCVDGWIQLC